MTKSDYKELLEEDEEIVEDFPVCPYCFEMNNDGINFEDIIVCEHCNCNFLCYKETQYIYTSKEIA